MDPLIAIGEQAPNFRLPDLEGDFHSLEDWRGKIVVVEFWSAECPWVERADRVLLSGLERWGEGVVFLPVAANAHEPQELIAETAAQRGLPRVLLDREQQAVTAFQAQTTPHLFIIDGEGRLRYRGAVDDVTFRRRTPTRFYAGEAVEALLQGREPDPVETAAYGCVIVSKEELS